MEKCVTALLKAQSNQSREDTPTRPASSCGKRAKQERHVIATHSRVNSSQTAPDAVG